MRRLPIYFLIDTKFDIASDSLAAMNNALHLLIKNFRQNPQLIETAIVSINSLSENNYQINPLIELEYINSCQLIATQSCFLGKSLSLLGEFLQKQELSKDKSEKKDWEATIFIFLHNYPEDNFIKSCNHFKKLRQRTIIIVFDNSIDLMNLKLLSENIWDYNNIDSSAISKFFWWSEDIFPFSEKTDFSENIINLKK